jgi:hypothetical protein
MMLSFNTQYSAPRPQSALASIHRVNRSPREGADKALTLKHTYTRDAVSMAIRPHVAPSPHKSGPRGLITIYSSIFRPYCSFKSMVNALYQVTSNLACGSGNVLLIRSNGFEESVQRYDEMLDRVNRRRGVQPEDLHAIEVKFRHSTINENLVSREAVSYSRCGKSPVKFVISFLDNENYYELGKLPILLHSLAPDSVRAQRGFSLLLAISLIIAH